MSRRMIRFKWRSTCWVFSSSILFPQKFAVHFYSAVLSHVLIRWHWCNEVIKLRFKAQQMIRCAVRWRLDLGLFHSVWRVKHSPVTWMNWKCRRASCTRCTLSVPAITANYFDQTPNLFKLPLTVVLMTMTLWSGFNHKIGHRCMSSERC